MTAALVAICLFLVAAGGTTVTFTRAPERQAVTLSIFGLMLTLLFFVLQAPDVALAQLTIGTAVVPLMVLLTIRKVRGGR